MCHGDGKPGKIEAVEQHDQKKSHALCQDCHEKEAAAGNKKAPAAKCDGCHEKKAAAS